MRHFTNYWRCIISMVILCLSSCTNSPKHKQSEEIAADVSLPKFSSKPPATSAISTAVPPFNIVSRNVSEIVTGIKKSEYIIVINNKYREQDLDKITNQIAKNDKDGIKRIFVSFYLNDMSLKGPNYALSMRSPETNYTKINYTDPIEENNNTPYKNAEIIGKWSMIGGAITIIYKKNASYYMIDHYDANNYGDPMKLIKYTIDGNTSFRYAEDTGETFVIMEDGLYGYMDGDFACVFSKLRQQ